MTLRALLVNSLIALRHPIRALEAIPADVRLPYHRLIPALLLSGLVWETLHFRIVNNTWMFRIPQPAAGYALATFALFPLVAWALTGLGLRLVSRRFGRPRTQAWCDAAACHLWMAWMVSLLADLLHLVPGVSLRTVASVWDGQIAFIMHAGWWVMFPLLTVQLMACWRVVTARSWRTAAAFAAGCLVLMRGGFRPLPELLHGLMQRLGGASLDFWVVACATAAALGLAAWLMRRESLRPVTIWWRAALFMAALLLAQGWAASTAWADACAAAGTGNWNADATWNTCHEGTGSPYPQAGDTVSIIPHGVTVTADAAASSVVLGTSSGYSGALVVNSGVTLTLGGTTATTLNNNCAGCGVTINGTITMSADGGGVTNAGTVTVSSTGTLKTKGGMAGAGTYSLDAASTVLYNKSTADTVAALTYGNLTLGDGGTSTTYTAGGNLTSAGTLTVASTDTFDVSNRTITLSGSGTTVLTITGSITTTGSTINYTGSSATTVAPLTYNNLGVGTTSDTGSAVTYSLGNSVTVSDTLTVGNSSSTNADVLDPAGFQLIFQKTGSGITPFNLTSKGSLNPSGTVLYNCIASTVTLAAATYNNLEVGTLSDVGSASTYTLGGNTSVAGTLTIGNASSTNSDVLNASSFTLTLSGTTGTPLTVTSKGTFTASTSTVAYTGNNTGGDTTIVTVTYNHLTLNNGSEQFVVNGTTTVGGDLTVTAGTLVLNGQSVTVSGGDLTGAGTIRCGTSGALTTCTAGTVTVAGTGNVGGGDYDFYNLTLGGALSSSTLTTAGDFEVKAVMTCSGTFFANSFNFSDDTVTLSGTGAAPFACDSNYAGTTFNFGTSTFIYSGVNAGGTVTPAFNSYYNLQFTGAETYDLTGATTAGGVLTVGASATLDGKTYTLTLSGTSGTPWSMASDRFTESSSTVVYSGNNGGGDTTVNTNSSYYNLTLNNSSETFAPGATLTATNILTVTAGTLAMGTNALTVGTVNGAGQIVGAGNISQSSAATTTLYGTGNLGGTGTTAGTCSGTSGTYTFYNLTVGDGSNTRTTTTCGDFTVSNGLTISASHTLDGGASRTITIAGTSTPFTKTGTFTASSSTVNYTGAGSTTVTAATYNNLGVKPGADSATHTFATGTTTVGGTLTVGNGTNTGVTVTAATNSTTLDVNDSVSIAANTTLTAHASNSFTVAGSWTNAGTFTHSNGRVTFDAGATNKTITSGGSSFYNVTFNNASGEWELQDTTTVANDLTLTAGALSLNGKDLTVSGGDLTVAASQFIYCGNGNNTCSAGTVTVNGTSGSGASTGIGGSGSTTFYNLSTGGGVDLGGTVTVKNDVSIIGNNSLSLNGKDLTVNGGDITFTTTGAIFCGNGGNTCSAGTVTVTGTSATGIGGGGASGTTFYNLAIGDGSTSTAVKLAGNATASNDVSVTASASLSLNAKNLIVNGGDLTGSGTIYCGNGDNTCAAGTMTLDAAGTLGGGTYTFYNVTLGNGTDSTTTTASGSWTAKNVLTVALNQTLDAGSATITLAGTTGTPFVVNGLFSCSTSTIVFSGNNAGGDTALISDTYHHLQVTGAETYTLPDAIVVGGVLTIGTDATLSPGSQAITFTGSGTPFVVTGVFTPGTGTVGYQATSGTTNVTATTYSGLGVGATGGTFQMGTAGSQTITATGGICFTAGSIDFDTYDPNVAASGTYAACSRTFGIFTVSSVTYTKGSGTITVSGASTLGDNGGTKQDLGTLVVDGTTTTATGLKVTSMTINNTKSLDISGDTLTLTGSGTPLTITGTLTEDASSVVEFTNTGTTTVNGRTYGGGLKINGTGGTFNAGGNIVVAGNLTLSAGTLAMSTRDLTVGTGSGTGHIVGAGAISQSASATTTLKGSGNLGGTSATTPGTCSGTNGTYTLYNLTLGDGTNAKTTTTCGDFTVSNVLTVRGTGGGDAANHELSGGSAVGVEMYLAGTTIPFVVNGTFTPGSVYVFYTGAGAKVTPTTYKHLGLSASGTVTLGTGAGQTITTNGKLAVFGGTVDAATYNPTININGSGPVLSTDYALALQDGASWQKGSGTVTFGGSVEQEWADGNAGANSIQNIGTVVVNNDSATGLLSSSNVKADSVTVNGSKIFNISGDTLTLVGTGTPLTVTGTLTENSSSIVEYAATSGVTTVAARTYAGGLKINGNGGEFDTGGNVTVTGTLTDTAGELVVGNSHTVTAANVTINGGALTLSNSGGVVKISGNGALSMSSGSLVTTDVATAPQLTTSDTATPTYVGVSITGGTLDVEELAVDYLKSAGFVIGSGATVTQFDKVTWGSSGTWNGQGASGELLLDITSQTANLLSHVFPTTWTNFTSADCNVRANTSGTVSLWDWTGVYGGEENDCDNTGEVVWKGGSGGASGASGSGSYPAIY